MSTRKGSKLNRLLLTQPHGVVFLPAWLQRQGYSPGLLKRYKASKWLEPVGFGALKRFGDKVGYEGAIYALQTQLGLSVHPGAKTALALLGRAHYLELSPRRLTLFGGEHENLPGWFTNLGGGMRLDYHRSKFLPPDAGLVDLDLGSFRIKISGPARALMECLHLAPKRQDLAECYQLMEGLNSLRPETVQRLLEDCASIKVKRLFLYLAEKAAHAWLGHLRLDAVDLGKGKRSLVSQGVFNRKYGITIPRELEAQDAQPGL